MSIGERIVALRTERKMSQSDLAEALNVSRQSISKWETDSSVPELDKLINLCEIFGISMDMLVRGISSEAEPETECLKTEPSQPGKSEQSSQPGQSAEPGPASPTHEGGQPGSQPSGQSDRRPQQVVHTFRIEGRMIASIICFMAAFVCIIIGAFAGDLAAGLIMELPFVICGVICFASKKRPGLWCAWAVYLIGSFFSRFATGINVHALWAVIRGDILFNVNTIVSAAWFLLSAALIIFTVRSFRNVPVRFSKTGQIGLAAGWVGLFVLWRLISRSYAIFATRIGYLIYVILDEWLLFIALNVLLVYTWNWYKQR